MATNKGERGRRGEKGRTGQRGPIGRTGPSATRRDILAAVQDEFAELGKQLRIQLERTAQMQAQLDAIHNLLKQMLAVG
jgi:hypothetical protein